MSSTRKTALLATLFFGFSLWVLGQQEIPTRLEKFIKGEEDYVFRLAENATDLFNKRKELVEKCTCSKHACSNDFDDVACVDYVKKYHLCDLEGRRFDFENSVFRVPPGTDMNHINDDLKQSICVYRHMEDYVKENGGPQYLTTYIGTVDGHMRLFPGIPRERYLVNGTEDDYECQPYDPRLRPWFIRASTGPKDIVFVIDKSSSMKDFVDEDKKTTKWDLVRNAVAKMLETLTFTDFVNIVLFSDNATTVWNKSGLARANETNIKSITKTLMQETAHNHTHFKEAFETAFPLLWHQCHVEDAQCSNCEKVILFLTDGRDTSINGKSIKPSEMARIIEKGQKELEKRTHKRATIFTFSMSMKADDAIPRQIACANSGAWAYIGTNTNPLDALNSYYLHMAAGMKSRLPIWIEPYEDASGLGKVTTVAVPFHTTSKDNDADIFLGVIGHQVLFKELRHGRTTERDILNELIVRSELCGFSNETPCELQIYRHNTGDQSVCTDPFQTVSEETEEAKNNSTRKPRPSALCYEHNNDFYRRSLEEVTWEKAVEKCREEEGELVSIGDETELAFLSSLAAVDGSWIGLRKASFQTFGWLDDNLSEIQNDSAFWGLQEPIYDDQTENCAAIDSRGIIGNLCAKRCYEERSYICKFEADEPCKGKIGKAPAEGYFEIPPLSICGKKAEEHNGNRPDPGVKNLTFDDVVCPVGEPPKTNEEVICCVH